MRTIPCRIGPDRSMVRVADPTKGNPPEMPTATGTNSNSGRTR